MHDFLKPIVFRDGRSLPCRILPGPMEGVTEGSFVQVMSAANLVRSWFTPFIRISSGVPRRSKLTYKIHTYLESGLPVIAQVMGTNGALLAETARRLHELGATCVDLNCACPSVTVIGNRSGGWLLTEPEWIHDAILAMKAACGEHAVSVKIRCGFYGDDEMQDIAAAIREAKPDMVTCHFRTVRDTYRPIGNGLERLARMRELLPDVTLIGSGDLFTVQDALRMRDQAGVDGVAPARGLLKNPALLREIEAACGGKPFAGTMDDAQKLAFLEQVGAMSGRSLKDQGFVLKIAKVMYGEQSTEFLELMGKR